MPTSSTPTTPSGRPAASVEELDAAPTKVGRYQRTFLAAGCVVASGASIIGCSAPPEDGNIRSIGRTKSALGNGSLNGVSGALPRCAAVTWSKRAGRLTVAL